MYKLLEIGNTFIDLYLVAVYFIYFIFSLIIIRQVSLMSNSVITTVNNIVKVFAYINLIIALILLFSSIL